MSAAIKTDHECAGCGGARQVPAKDRFGWIAYPVTCPVCNGAGRISDRMPVADALADAETLRAFVRDPYPPHLLLRMFCPSAYDVDPSALRCGISADLWKRGHFYETERGLVNDAVWAARAAFRAVPGLREAVLVIALFLSAAGAHADVFDVAVITAAASDVVSTEVALRQGYVEQNIQGRGMRIGANIVVTGAALLAASELEKSGHRGWSRVVKVGTALAWGLNTARNLRTMRGGLR